MIVKYSTLSSVAVSDAHLDVWYETVKNARGEVLVATANQLLRLLLANMLGDITIDYVQYGNRKLSIGHDGIPEVGPTEMFPEHTSILHSLIKTRKEKRKQHDHR